MIWKFELSLKVAENWVEDGFNPTPEQVEEAIKNSMLTYANSNEFQVNAKLITKPDKKKIDKLQGR